MDLNQPIESFRYVGPVYLKRLQRLGVKTIGDLFYHFPFRYDDFSNLKKISELKIGEEATIEGKVKEIKTRRSPVKKMFLTEALIEDETGTIKSIWFNQPYLAQTLTKNKKARFAGKIKESKNGILFSNPVYEILEADLDAPSSKAVLIHTQGLVPVYPETEGISSRWLRRLIYQLLQEYAYKIEEFLPEEILKKKGFPDINTSLFQIHFPKNKKEAEIAKKRFAFEELFLIQLFYQKQKKNLKQKPAPKIIPRAEYIEAFKKNLPFSFTEDQKKVMREILDDMQKGVPMSRLLEGEVGSGKTVVAALVSFVVVKNNHQVAIMAPTEILAEQHFKELIKLFKGLGVSIGLLTSAGTKIFDKNQKILLTPDSKNEGIDKKIKEEEFLKMIKGKGIDIVVGTHSLIQERVVFKNLGLVVIDEQHRFGVEQRAKLTKQPTNYNQQLIPHSLSMTATPIPRTLALALYGDLSISQIRQLPKGRKKIITKIVSSRGRNKVYEFLRQEVKKGHQGFVICPLIEESKKLSRPSTKSQFGVYLSLVEVKAAEKEFKKLKEKIFPDLKLGLLHGKMKQKEKEEIMREFKEGKIQILVSTPVVEVGIVVPNATVMIIEGADRFGLSQLYQFRGRVGRGEKQSYCFLFTESSAKRTRQRLNAIVSAKNAFELAEKDLKIRGPGDFIGTRQSGIPDLAMASLLNTSLVEEVKTEVEDILEKDPDFKNYPSLQKKMEEFKKKVFLE